MQKCMLPESGKNVFLSAMRCPCCGYDVDAGHHPALDKFVTMSGTGPRLITTLISQFGNWVSRGLLLKHTYKGQPPKEAVKSVRMLKKYYSRRLEAVGLTIEEDSKQGFRIRWTSEQGQSHEAN